MDECNPLRRGEGESVLKNAAEDDAYVNLYHHVTSERTRTRATELCPYIW